MSNWRPSPHAEKTTLKKPSLIRAKETEDWRYIYQNELNKAFFQHDIADGDFKDLTRRKASNKILRYKAKN